MAALTGKAKIAGTSLALFCLSLFLTAHSAKNPKVAQIGAAAIGELVRPVQTLNQGVQTGISGAISHYFWLVGVKEKNEVLNDRLKALEAENSRLKELFNENQRLKELLGVTERTNLKGVAAEVIGYSPSNWVRSISLNKGTYHGVEQGMPVLDGSGVVGQISSSGPTSSQALIITDHTSGVDAIIQDSRVRGVVEGSGGSRVRFRYVASDEKVAVGDRVISSGMDTVFPKGMLIGIVAHIDKRPNSLFQDIYIKPAVQFSKLESVLVVTSSIEVSPEEDVVEEEPKKEEEKAEEEVE